MSVFDVRGNDGDVINEIIFADETGYDYPHKIIKRSNEIVLVDEESNEVSIQFKDVNNFISALQKAIELGWVPAPKAAAVKKPVTKK